MTFERRLVELEPAEELWPAPAQWRDAIVFLTDGELEIECVSGRRARFGCGAILCFTGTMRAVRNCGSGPARLLTVSLDRNG